MVPAPGDVGANAFGYSVGLLRSFALSSRWTFAYRGPYLPALAKFVFVFLAGLRDKSGDRPEYDNIFRPGQLCCVVPFTLTLYMASKYLVFRNSV